MWGKIVNAKNVLLLWGKIANAKNVLPDLKSGSIEYQDLQSAKIDVAKDLRCFNRIKNPHTTSRRIANPPEHWGALSTPLGHLLFVNAPWPPLILEGE